MTIKKQQQNRCCFFYPYEAGAMAYVQFTMGLPVPGALQWAILSNVPMPSVNFQLGSWNFSLSLSLNFGQGFGIGLNGSIGYDDGNFSIAAGFGITSWSGGHFASGKTGIETRISAMAGYRGKDFGISLGTNFWSGSDGMKEFKQQTGLLRISSGDFSFSYENDGSPFDKKWLLGGVLGDGNDSHRTAAATLSVGDFSVGFNLFTGVRTKDMYAERGGIEAENMTTYAQNNQGFFKRLFSPIPQGLIKDGINYPFGIVNEKGSKYRFGGLYVGYGNSRLGINSDRHVRYPIQVIGAHYLASPQPGQQVMSLNNSSFLQYKTKNPFTSW